MKKIIKRLKTLCTFIETRKDREADITLLVVKDTLADIIALSK